MIEDLDELKSSISKAYHSPVNHRTLRKLSQDSHDRNMSSFARLFARKHSPYEIYKNYRQRNMSMDNEYPDNMSRMSDSLDRGSQMLTLNRYKYMN